MHLRQPTLSGSRLAVLLLIVTAFAFALGEIANGAEAYSEINVELRQVDPASLGIDDHAEHPETATSEEYTSASEVVDASFDMVGFLWTGGEVTEAWVQTRSLQKGWSEWTLLGSHNDDSGGRAGTDPFWAPGSDGFRVALVGNPVGVRAGLVRSEKPEKQVPSLVVPQHQYDEASPTGVRPREDWDTDGCRPGDAHSSFSDVQGIVIHHASGNDYTQAEVPAIIRSMCRFHVSGRGWSDIGYNFLVDKFGGVWEGRTNSLDAPISGAHAFGFNSRTQGVAMLGNFEQATPTVAQEESLVDLLDWLTGWYLIDPTGQSWMVSRSDGSRFEEGEGAWLPSIMGHRDLGLTACPGRYVYDDLPTIRALVEPIPRDTPTSAGDELLVYSSDNGRYRYDNLASDGFDINPVGVGWYASSWTSVETLDLGGDGFDEIQFYAEDTGALAFHRLNGDGSLGDPIRTGTLGSGWTTMEPAETDGDALSELFFYRESDGRFGFYQLRPDGMLGHAIRVGWFGKGWTSVEPIDLDGDGLDEIMFYRSEDGRFALYDVASDGLLGTAIRIDNFGAGWDHLEPFDVDGDGDEELLFYRYWDGRYALYEIDESGGIGTNLGVGNYSNQWTSLSSPDLDE